MLFQYAYITCTSDAVSVEGVVSDAGRCAAIFPSRPRSTHPTSLTLRLHRIEVNPDTADIVQARLLTCGNSVC